VILFLVLAVFTLVYLRTAGRMFATD
jgi:hypothetical protein